MTISILLMKQIAQLFLMIFMGYLIVKTGIVEDTDSKVLSKIILYLVIPCVIINAFQVDYTSDTVKGLFLAFIASVITQMILILGLQQFGFHSVMIRQKTNAKSARVDPMLLKKTQIQSLFAFLLPLISNCGLHTCQYCD